MSLFEDCARETIKAERILSRDEEKRFLKTTAYPLRYVEFLKTALTRSQAKISRRHRFSRAVLNQRILKSQAGFTLVEMMITAAIIGILLVAFTGWLFQNMKQTKDLNNTQSYTQLTGGVKDAAGQAEALSKSEAASFNPNLNSGQTPTPWQ